MINVDESLKNQKNRKLNASDIKNRYRPARLVAEPKSIAKGLAPCRLIFSDESGEWKREDCGYYIRSFLIVEELTYKSIKDEYETNCISTSKHPKDDCLCERILDKYSESIGLYVFFSITCETNSGLGSIEYQISGMDTSNLKRVDDTSFKNEMIRCAEQIYILNYIEKTFLENLKGEIGESDLSSLKIIYESPKFNKRIFKEMILDVFGKKVGTEFYNKSDKLPNEAGIQICDRACAQFSKLIDSQVDINSPSDILRYLSKPKGKILANPNKVFWQGGDKKQPWYENIKGVVKFKDD